jgi:hypothetical protein
MKNTMKNLVIASFFATTCVALASCERPTEKTTTIIRENDTPKTSGVELKINGSEHGISVETGTK